MTFSLPNDSPAAVLSREADHRVANNLALIVGLLRLRARAVRQRTGKLERREVSAMLEDIALRVEMVARLHRMLSQPCRGALVDLGGYLRELCAALSSSLASNATVQVTHEAGDACALPPDNVLTLGLLVSELVTNAVKYAHPTGLPVAIEIRCRRTAAGSLTIDMVDDGIGLPENFDPESDGGLGLRLVYSLATQLGASLRFDSGPLGTRVQLEMPVPSHGLLQ